MWYGYTVTGVELAMSKLKSKWTNFRISVLSVFCGFRPCGTGETTCT